MELKWLETGLVMFSPILEAIWIDGTDRRGTGIQGRYTAEDVARNINALYFALVGRRFGMRTSRTVFQH